MSRHNITELSFVDISELLASSSASASPKSPEAAKARSRTPEAARVNGAEGSKDAVAAASDPASQMVEQSLEHAADVLVVEAEGLEARLELLGGTERSFELYAQLDASSPEAPLMACRTRLGEPSRRGERLLLCPHAKSEQPLFDDKIRALARLPVEGILLEEPDAWYANTPLGAGFCLQCADRFEEILAEAMGEQHTPFDALDLLIESDLQPLPYGGEHQRMVLGGGFEHGARLIRRARDEARSHRGVEIGVGARLTGFNPVALRLATRLDLSVFPIEAPTPERLGLGAAEVFRVAAGRRSAVAQLSAQGSALPGTVLQAARLATAVGVDLALDPAAPQESVEVLAEHRRRWRLGRKLPRPYDQLSEALLLYSPSCDHFSGGVHGQGVLEAAEALSALGVQYRVVLEVPAGGSQPLVLVDAHALPEEDARRTYRRISGGAGAVVVGRVASVDEDGRSLMGPFPELRSGLNRVGDGTVFSFDPAENGSAPGTRNVEGLSGPLESGLSSLWGRGRRALSVSGARVLVKTFIDPDRKLDIHLVGRDFNPESATPIPVSGAILLLSGPAVGGARVGRLLFPDGSEHRVPLIPFGIGVRVNLPEFPGAAIFTVSR